MKDITERLKDIVIEVASIDSLEKKDSLKSKGVSSLKLLLILNEVEKAFNIQIPDEELIMSNFDSLETIGKLILNIHQGSLK